jgi:DNA-binding transcriptional LysR family regulator
MAASFALRHSGYDRYTRTAHCKPPCSDKYYLLLQCSEPRVPASLDLDQVRAFCAVAEAGSFTRAAHRLDRTQSAISLQIRKLEDMLGRRLFERNARRVRLTGEGEALLGDCRRMVALNDALVARVAEPELEGVVRFGSPEDFATTHLPEVLSAFAHAHPRVALEVTCDLTLNLTELFDAGQLDLALVKRAPMGPGADVMVWREPLVWAAAPGWRPDPHQPTPLIVAPRPCVYRERATRALDGAGRAWRVAYASPSLAGALAALRAELGVAILPKAMVAADLDVLGASEGLPPLADTEIALRKAARLSRPAARLAEAIVSALDPERRGAAPRGLA